MAQPAAPTLAAAASESQRPGYGDGISGHRSPASGSSPASLKLRQAAGGTLLAPTSRDLGAWDAASSRGAPEKRRSPARDDATSRGALQKRRPLTIDTSEEASAELSTLSGLASNKGSGHRLEKPAETAVLSPDAYDVVDGNRTWTLQGKTPKALGPKVVWPSDTEGILVRGLGFPAFGSASKVAPAPDRLGMPANPIAFPSGSAAVMVPPVPPHRDDQQHEAEGDMQPTDGAHPERRLRETANVSEPSQPEATDGGGFMQERQPHQSTPGAQRSFVELPGHHEAALASMAERERHRHPVRDALAKVGARVPDDLWDFLVDWFGIEQFTCPMQYLEMDRMAAAKVKDIVEADVEGQHQEAMMVQHRPYFTVAQSIFALALWFILSLKDYDNDGSVHWTLMKAGLDSIWPGETDLRVGLECKDTRAEVWRWLTYQYTHMGLAHVMMNVLLNLMLGVPLEGFHGSWRTVVMYNVGVFGGACCYFVTDVHHPAVGMSGGCYALIGTHLGCLLLNWHQKKYRWIKLFFLVLLAGADLLNAHLAVSNGDVHVSHAIHFGGYLAGVIICLVIGRNLVVKRWERTLIAAAIILGITYVTFCLAWGMSFPPQTIFEGVPWCWTRQVFDQQIFGDREWHCVRCADQACIDKWERERWIEEVSTWSCDRRGGWTVTER